MKKISIIVPIYNMEKYLNRMLDSLITQTYKNLEILLIDDGSCDNSGKICDEYAKRDNRIKVVHKTNKGVSISRNLGIELATGDYIGFVDSDDTIDKMMYEKLYTNLVNNDCDISACNYCTFSTVPVFKYSNKIDIFNKEEALKDIISNGLITNFLWNKLFKKEIFNNILFPSGKIYEDIYVMPKLLENINKLCFDNSKLYGYFFRTDSCVNTYNKSKNMNYLEFNDSCYNHLKKYQFLQDDLIKYKTFYIYSAYLQAAKSSCKDIFNDEDMNKYYQLFRKYFKLNSNYSLERKLLFLILYINKNLFYILINLLK